MSSTTEDYQIGFASGIRAASYDIGIDEAGVRFIAGVCWARAQRFIQLNREQFTKGFVDGYHEVELNAENCIIVVEIATAKEINQHGN
jgi:hypothetical protein